jgi:hypothetical protein
MTDQASERAQRRAHEAVAKIDAKLDTQVAGVAAALSRGDDYDVTVINYFAVLLHSQGADGLAALAAGAIARLARHEVKSR